MQAYKHKHKGKCMDKQEDKLPEDTKAEEKPENGQSENANLNKDEVLSKIVTSKKSHKKLWIIIALVVAVIVVAAVGLLYYKMAVLDPQAERQAAEESAQVDAANDEEKKELTPEEEVTATLTENVKKQIEALQQNDDSKAISNSTSAATSVGRDLNEDELEE